MDPSTLSDKEYAALEPWNLRLYPLSSTRAVIGQRDREWVVRRKRSGGPWTVGYKGRLIASEDLYHLFRLFVARLESKEYPRSEKATHRIEADFPVCRRRDTIAEREDTEEAAYLGAFLIGYRTAGGDTKRHCSTLASRTTRLRTNVWDA